MWAASDAIVQITSIHYDFDGLFFLEHDLKMLISFLLEPKTNQKQVVNMHRFCRVISN